MGYTRNTDRGYQIKNSMKKILILTSNPRHDLKLDREIKDLKNVIKRSKNQSQFETEFELEVHPEELQDLLLEHEPRIVHFCGHGTGEQGLVLEDRSGGEQVVSTEALSNLFALFDKSCECVVLNACYSEVQAGAIVQHINYVVGMSHEIRDDAAIAFATGFYRALGWGKSIDEAYKFGRNAIQIQLAKNNTSRSRSGTRQMVAVNVVEQAIVPEDLKPVLKQKSPLTPFPQSVTSTPLVDQPGSSPPPQLESNFPPELIAAVREEERYKHYRERARQTWDEFGQSTLVERSISQNEYRQRKTLVNKVKQFWIEGFLKPSLYANSAIDLNWQNSPDAVLRPFEGMADIPVELDESFEELSSTEILSQTGQGKTLLILGEPGSGKTITLLQLAEKLVDRSEADLSQPIPVVFNLSTWGQKQQPIEKWLIEEFKDKYQVPKTWSEPWLERQQLILLLDGLDEVRADRRDACVRALNQFIATHNITETVVCSRVKDYQALTERLQLSSALCLKPLSAPQVYSFLTKAGDSLTGLKTLLQQDKELEQFAQTPLILNIMSMAYQGWSAEKLLQQFRTSGDRYRHLFDSYIERMLTRRLIGQSKQIQYPTEKVLHWLSWLAKTMVNESKIIFLIEKMQPSLLESRSEKRAYRIWNFMLPGLSVALSSILSFGLIFTLVFMLIRWLIVERSEVLSYGWTFGRSFTIGYGLTVGLTYGLIVGVMACLSSEIHLFEQMKWSWQRAKSVIIPQVLIYGLIGGLSYAPIKGISFGLSEGLGFPLGFGPSLVLSYALSEGLCFALSFALIGGINSGMSSMEVKQRTIPNQGIWSSKRNSVRMGLSFGLIVGLIVGLNSTWNFGLNLEPHFVLSYALSFVLSFVLSFALIFALIFGGITCIKHFNLRRILHRKGRIPWNYARFLDYASDRLLMKKVGGGYVFYHRMLMEHFAQRHQVSPNSQPTTQSATQVDLKTNPASLACNNCGQQNPLNNKFCSKCGSQLTKPDR